MRKDMLSLERVYSSTLWLEAMNIGQTRRLWPVSKVHIGEVKTLLERENINLKKAENFGLISERRTADTAHDESPSRISWLSKSARVFGLQHRLLPAPGGPSMPWMPETNREIVFGHTYRLCAVLFQISYIQLIPPKPRSDPPWQKNS